MATEYGRQFVELGQEMAAHGNTIQGIAARAGEVATGAASAINALDETAAAILETQEMLGQAIAAMMSSSGAADETANKAVGISNDVQATTSAITEALDETTNPLALEARLLCFRAGARLDDGSREAYKANTLLLEAIAKSTGLDTALKNVRDQIVAVREMVVNAGELGGQSEGSLQESRTSTELVEEKLRRYGERL